MGGINAEYMGSTTTPTKSHHHHSDSIKMVSY